MRSGKIGGNLKKSTTKVIQSHPGITVSGGHTSPAQTGPDGMTPEELEYRTMLQEAIRWVTVQVLEEQRADILKRAETRVLTLMELRGES